ncbi:MAG: LysE family translocator [Pseudomonadota bacterium]
MTNETWLALTVALVILGLSPGPAWAAVITSALGRGFGSAFAMALGVALGDVVFLLLAVFGLAVAAQTLGEFFLFVKLAGAAYLIWLGLNLWRNPPAAPEARERRPDTSQTTKRAFGPFLAGFSLTLGNPKVIAFYLGFLPAFVDLARLSVIDTALLSATAFAVIAGLLTGYAALAARSRRLFQQSGWRRILGRVLGTTLIGTGIVVATR